jgi:hypothetical protein
MFDDAEIRKLIDDLKTGAVEVDVDVHPYIPSASLKAVEEMSAARDAAIKRGERVVYVYTEEWTRRHAGWRVWLRASAVDSDNARRLLAAGAKWIGPDHLKP